MHKSNLLLKIFICSVILGTSLSFSSCSSKENAKTEKVAKNQKGKEANKAQKSGSAVNTKYKTIMPASLKMRMEAKQDMVILDVRTPDEVKEGKIEGAVVIDFYDKDFSDQIDKLDKDKVYYVYCRSGKRSAETCKIMADAGFTKLFNVRGGYNDWETK